MQGSAAGHEPDRGFWMLTGVQQQEFSIEIPDKDADAIHSGKQPHLTPGLPAPGAGHISYGFCGRGQRDRLTRFSSQSRQGRRVHPEPTRCPLNHGPACPLNSRHTTKCTIQRRQTGRHQTHVRDAFNATPGRDASRRWGKRVRASKPASDGLRRGRGRGSHPELCRPVTGRVCGCPVSDKKANVEMIKETQPRRQHIWFEMCCDIPAAIECLAYAVVS